MAETTPITDSFSTLWRLISNLFDESLPYNAQLNLESKINTILAAQKEKFTPTKENVILFCDTIGDYSPIHRDDEASQEFGKRFGLKFERRLVPATQINANLGEFVEDTVGLINQILEEYGHSLVFSGSGINFPVPVYPGNTVRWNIANYGKVNKDKIEEGIHLSVLGVNKKREVIFPDIATRLNKGYSSPIDMKDSYLYADSFKFSITEESLSNYLIATGEEMTKIIPWSYIIALVTSALLKISEDKDGVPSGINRGINFDFYRKPCLGEVEVGIFLNKSKHYKRLDKYWYLFDARCYQDNKILVTGQIDVLADKEPPV